MQGIAEIAVSPVSIHNISITKRRDLLQAGISDDNVYGDIILIV
ncbi:MAG: hypothetical protein R6V48_00725 [Fidelibacterota bacterium]